MIFLELRDAVTEVMLNEIETATDEEQIKIMMYTQKILSSIEKKLNVNLKIDNNSWLHTGKIPECCIGCNNYKEGQVSVCNCTLPCIDLLKGLIE